MTNQTKSLKIQQKEQILAQLEQKAQQEYQEQKNWINLTTPLANNPKIKELFLHLLQIFADRYAESKQIDNSNLPLYFGGFYQKAFLKEKNKARWVIVAMKSKIK